MALEFTHERWKEVKVNSAKWWNGEIGRPLIQVRLNGKDADRKKPSIPFHFYTSYYDYSITAEQIVDCWDYQLSQTLYMGDAYPCIIPNFGPGVIAAFLGASLVSEEHTVWFHPERDYKINELNFKYLPENENFLRVKNIVETADKKWKGLVQISMTDLGGSLDVVSSFLPSEKLLFDLYDNPESVKKVLWTVSDLWMRYFKELSSATPNNPGYTHWALVFSNESHYILQCDFSYMIGPEQFDEFVLPELKSTSQKLNKAFYHLDGIGELAHLDSILKVDSIQGIQWVPGAGQPDITKWPDVFKKISDAGKKIQFSSAQADDPFVVLDVIEKQTGRLDNVVYTIEGDISQEKDYRKLINKYIR